MRRVEYAGEMLGLLSESESESGVGELFEAGVHGYESLEGSWLWAAAEKRRASKSVVMKEGLRMSVLGPDAEVS